MGTQKGPTIIVKVVFDISVVQNCHLPYVGCDNLDSKRSKKIDKLYFCYLELELRKSALIAY